MSKKGFLGIVGSMVYGFYVLYSAVIRISCIIVYFSIPMGLFNLLEHWFYETANLEWRNGLSYSIFNTTTEIYEDTRIDDIKDKLLSKDKEGTLLKYTGLALRQYFLIFMAWIILHYLLIMVMIILKKRFGFEEDNEIDLKNIHETSEVEESRKTIKKTENSKYHRFWRKYMTYVFSSIVVPEISDDWDKSNVDIYNPKTDGSTENEIIEV